MSDGPVIFQTLDREHHRKKQFYLVITQYKPLDYNQLRLGADR